VHRVIMRGCVLEGRRRTFERVRSGRGGLTCEPGTVRSFREPLSIWRTWGLISSCGPTARMERSGPLAGVSRRSSSVPDIDLRAGVERQGTVSTHHLVLGYGYTFTGSPAHIDPGPRVAAHADGDRNVMCRIRRLIGWAMEEQMPTALVAGALDMAVGRRGGRVAGVIFHSDRGSICPTSAVPSATATASASRPAGWPRASTTRRPNRSGRASNGSSSTATGSPPEPTPRPPSPRGSSATTPSDCTRPSATYRRSSGSCTTVSSSSEPHGQVSGWRGEVHGPLNEQVVHSRAIREQVRC